MFVTVDAQLAIRVVPIITPLLGLLILLYFRLEKRRWPDLWKQRRKWLPLLERVDASVVERLPKGYRHDPKLGAEFGSGSYAGHLDATPAEVRADLRSRDHVFPRNLAMCKYVVRNGRRVYEVGSYARVPDGFAGRRQDPHIRLVPGARGGTDVYAHSELNPWWAPWEHYGSTDYDVNRGVRKARELLDIKTPPTAVAGP